jgi:hypothetical protein
VHYNFGATTAQFRAQASPSHMYNLTPIHSKKQTQSLNNPHALRKYKSSTRHVTIFLAQLKGASPIGRLTLYVRNRSMSGAYVYNESIDSSKIKFKEFNFFSVIKLTSSHLLLRPPKWSLASGFPLRFFINFLCLLHSPSMSS